MSTLADKTILITGASRGIGRAIALRAGDAARPRACPAARRQPGVSGGTCLQPLAGPAGRVLKSHALFLSVAGVGRRRRDKSPQSEFALLERGSCDFRGGTELRWGSGFDARAISKVFVD